MVIVWYPQTIPCKMVNILISRKQNSQDFFSVQRHFLAEYLGEKNLFLHLGLEPVTKLLVITRSSTAQCGTHKKMMKILYDVFFFVFFQVLFLAVTTAHQPSACLPLLSINFVCIFLVSSCLAALFSKFFIQYIYSRSSADVQTICGLQMLPLLRLQSVLYSVQIQII